MTVGWVFGVVPAFAGPYEDGLEALRSGRTTDAMSLLQQAVDADPGNVEAWWELGWASWNGDDLAGASRAWSQVEKLDPDHEDLGMWLAAAKARSSYRAFRDPLPAVETTPDSRRIRLVAGGDTMMGSDRVKGAAGLPAGDGDVLFDDVRPLLQSADIAFLNLEGPLADGLESTKCAPDSTSCYAFRTPTRFAGAVQRAGIDLAQLANNHALDVGTAGQESTMRALDGVKIAHAGRYGDVGIVERNGLKVALVAAHSGSCCLNVNQLDEVKAAVALADKEADLVVFGYHGGAEGADHRHVTGQTEVAWGEKRGNVKALAHAAIDAGADLVIGTGPHVLRAMEVYKGRMIAYSLGNFMGYRQFGTAGGYGGRTVLLDVTLAGNGVVVEGKLHPILLDEDSVPHPDPAGDGLDHVRELTAADFPQTGVTVADDGTLSWPKP
ncbi:MAG: CapA family protein [Myxococcota bacterium]